MRETLKLAGLPEKIKRGTQFGMNPCYSQKQIECSGIKLGWPRYFQNCKISNIRNFDGVELSLPLAPHLIVQ